VDPGDARVHALLAVVGHGQGLGVALRLVVDAPGTDRIHVAPVVLVLGVDLRIAINLGGRGQEEPGPLELGQPEHVMSPVRPDLEGVQREARVVDRTRRRCEVVDEVDFVVQEHRLGEVRHQEREGGIADVLDVLERAGVEVVEADHPVALGQKVIAKMRAEKPCSSGDHARAHPRG
jgi:hypothetical protein